MNYDREPEKTTGNNRLEQCEEGETMTTSLPMTDAEIRMRYRDGTSVQILADLNACGTYDIKRVLGAEQQRIHPDKPAAPKPKPWKEKAKELYGKFSDSEIARRVGSTQFSVRAYRIELGIPVFSAPKAGHRSREIQYGKPPEPTADQLIENEPIEPRPKDPDVQFTHSFPEPDCIVEVPFEVVNQMVVDHLAASVAVEDCPGKKATGKPRLSLVPPSLIEAVGRVRTYGTEKYGSPDNWKQVDPELFKDALMRHICDYLRDPLSVDAESGLPHLEHIACNVAFLLEMEEQK
ncbi:MAG: DUF5664 domain-containing protein [Oscillospiraceae bacterium]|nr:DUF5664 domain-containing protein [Oscillospiraceae bacterium]